MTRSSSETFDPYHKWLGISPDRRPPTHYDLLAVSLDEEDREVIDAAAEQRIAFVRSKLGTASDATVYGVIAQIQEAQITLGDPEARRDYDHKHKLFGKRRKKRQVDPSASPSGNGQPQRPPKSRGRTSATVGEDSGIVRTYAGVVGVLLIAFCGAAWWSFQQPWEAPPTVTEAERENALFDAIAGSADENGPPDQGPASQDDAGDGPSGDANIADASPVPATPAAEEATTAIQQPSFPRGLYLVKCTDHTGGAGEVQYEFMDDRTVWKAGRLI